MTLKDFGSKIRHSIEKIDGIEYKVCTDCERRLTLDKYKRINPWNPRLSAKCLECCQRIRKLYSIKRKNDKRSKTNKGSSL